MRQFINLLLQKSLVPLNNLRLKRNPNEKLLVSELRKKVRHTGFLKKGQDLSHNQWIGNLAILKKKILTENPKNFLQWAIIRNTMFIGNAIFTLKEFKYLRQNNWGKWKKAVNEKNFIPVEPYLLYPKSSGNLIHQAYHLAQFEKTTWEKIKDFDFIFEYGGGYGSMCQLVHNLGFKGKYLIFDFSIISALQVFFLKMNGLSASNNPRDTKNQILCLDNLKDVKRLLSPKGKSLFMATWSLSESPLKIREQVFPLIENFKHHLIAYQNQFNEVDNKNYFKNYQKKLKKLSWRNKEIEQLGSHNYLFGFS